MEYAELLEHGRMTDESWSELAGLSERLSEEELRRLIDLLERASDPRRLLRPEHNG